MFPGLSTAEKRVNVKVVYSTALLFLTRSRRKYGGKHVGHHYRRYLCASVWVAAAAAIKDATNNNDPGVWIQSPSRIVCANVQHDLPSTAQRIAVSPTCVSATGLTLRRVARANIQCFVSWSTAVECDGLFMIRKRK